MELFQYPKYVHAISQFVTVDRYSIFNLHLSSEKFFHVRICSCDKCKFLFCSHFFFSQIIKLNKYKCSRIHRYILIGIPRVVIYKKKQSFTTYGLNVLAFISTVVLSRNVVNLVYI